MTYPPIGLRISGRWVPETSDALNLERVAGLYRIRQLAKTSYSTISYPTPAQLTLVQNPTACLVFLCRYGLLLYSI